MIRGNSSGSETAELNLIIWSIDMGDFFKNWSIISPSCSSSDTWRYFWPHQLHLHSWMRSKLPCCNLSSNVVVLAICTPFKGTLVEENTYFFVQSIVILLYFICIWTDRILNSPKLYGNLLLKHQHRVSIYWILWCLKQKSVSWIWQAVCQRTVQAGILSAAHFFWWHEELQPVLVACCLPRI